MKVSLFTVWLGLWAATASAAPSGFLVEEERALVSNASGPLLFERSIHKREIFDYCENDLFRPVLDESFRDAVQIMQNMVKYLDLAVGLYREDESGELKSHKVTPEQRTWDENTGFRTYNILVSKIYSGPGRPENKEGLQRLKKTLAIARAVLLQFEAYDEGDFVEGRNRIAIHCDQAEYLAEKNAAGLTYTEDTRNTPKEGYYWLSQYDDIKGQSIWVPRKAVCSLHEGQSHTRFGSLAVPAPAGILAHAMGYEYAQALKLSEESITFCPSHFNQWRDFETSRVQSGLHFRNLHVEIGTTELSDDQTSARDRLLALPDFQGPRPTRRGIRWLYDFAVATLIHESTHTRAFVSPDHKAFDDVKCREDDNTQPEGFRLDTTTTPMCLSKVAKGVQIPGETNHRGHTDAQAFAVYAMATWVNIVEWYTFVPVQRRY